MTGVPGSGKSSLVIAMLGAWLGRGLKVAVVAVDPSSPIRGGAVLGDRIRMARAWRASERFMRSLAARGELGGLSRATSAAVDCFDAGRVRPHRRRDGRHRPVGNARRRPRRYPRRRLPARPRRRGPGAQGRHARDRRRARREHGRPAARRADGARDARDARPAPRRGRRRRGSHALSSSGALQPGGIAALLEAIDAHTRGGRPRPARRPGEARRSGTFGTAPRGRRRPQGLARPHSFAWRARRPRVRRSASSVLSRRTRPRRSRDDRRRAPREFQRRLPRRRLVRPRRFRLRPRRELARAGGRGHRRAHHLPGRRRRGRSAGRAGERSAPEAQIAVYRIEVVRLELGGGERAM